MTYGMGNVLVNPYLFNMMGPYGYTSNWGDSIQFNVMPSYFTPAQASLTHGILNPNHVSQWNPMFSVPVNEGVTHPALIQQGTQVASNWGRETFYGALANIKFANINNSLSSLRQQVTKLAGDKNLNQSQKNRFQQIILQTHQLQEQLQTLMSAARKSKSSNEALCDEVKKLEKEVEEFTTTSLKTADEIIAELKAGTQTPETSTQTSEQPETQTQVQPQGQQPTQSAQQTPQATTAQQAQQTPAEEAVVDEADAPIVQSYHKDGYQSTPQAQAVGKQIADAIYEAVDPNFGTDETQLEKAINCINEYTIMETLDAWNKSKASEFGGESMLESIYDDIFWGDKRAEYTTHILKALVKKAEMENVDISAETEAIVKELDCFWRDDEKIFKLINEIHKNLGGKEYKTF